MTTLLADDGVRLEYSEQGPATGRPVVLIAGFKAPAITVVGEVVKLRGKLRWFDNRPLSGRGIVVTRAADQAGEFSAMLAELGASVHECPTISIVPPEDCTELDRAIASLAGFHWLIFTSVNAVKYFFDRLAVLGLDTREIGACRVCAVGPKTAAALLLASENCVGHDIAKRITKSD